ncbi:MAG: AAC(3) family N-acetyltransferase [Bacteroidales bacterium]|nr:AAC(3) family N-acetyltransferase [Bacteroidales bacterium]
MDSPFIPYLEIPHRWGLEAGDTVLLSSDISGLVYGCMLHGQRFDVNAFLDEVMGILGPDGTLMLPTYNWDFCGGKTFDYRESPCKTGVLGTAALRRDDFIRTKHPIYSFAVKGRHSELLAGLDNQSSFGQDSPFAFMELVKAKNVGIGVDLTHFFTFVHYVEQQCGVSNYRYPKQFTAGYIDADGTESTRTYSMLVRDLDGYLGTDFSGMEEAFLQSGVMRLMELNEIEFRIVDMFRCAPIIREDIRHNASRKLCKHIWQ